MAGRLMPPRRREAGLWDRGSRSAAAPFSCSSKRAAWVILVADGFHSVLSFVDAGDSAGATGEVIKTKRGELSVRIDEFTLLQQGPAAACSRSGHGLQDVEQRHRRRYLDPDRHLCWRIPV